MYRFGDANLIKPNNFSAIALKFSEIFGHPFSQIFIFGNMFH